MNKRREKRNLKMRSIERIMPRKGEFFLRRILRSRNLKGIGHASLSVPSGLHCS